MYERKNHPNMEIKLSKYTFTPGDFVCGMLLVDASERNQIETIEIELFGSAKIFCRNEEIPELLNGVVLLSQFLHNEKILVDRRTILYQKPEPLLIELDDDNCDEEDDEKCGRLSGICPRRCHKDPEGLCAGRHGFPFEFQLPSDGSLESSFIYGASEITIKYHIIASTMAADGSVLMESSQPISVVKPSHSSQAPTAYGNSISTPASTQKIIDLKKSYSIIVNMQLPKTSFKPTEPIFPCITINNGWKASLKYVHFNIVQKIAYNAKPNGSPHLKTFTKMVDLTGVGLPATQKKIAPGSSFTFSPEYYVPALIPSFEIPHFLKVDYVAKLTIGHSPNQIFGDLTIPLNIVTHLDDGVECPS